jgi:8-oxo-dGTP pyrophosphatase MutT (NUDIX family)
MFSSEQAKNLPISVDISAGAVVLRGESGNRELLIVHRQKMQDSCLPKGHLESGESLQQGAIREVLEETGYPIQITTFINEMPYQVESASKLSHRIVYWFGAVLTDEPVVSPLDPEEIEKAEWVKVKDIDRFLSYENEKTIVRMALAR